MTIMASSSSSTEVARLSSDDVIERLDRFRILGHPRSETIFGWLPILLLLLILADWLVGGGAFSRDTFRMTGVLMVVLVLAAIQVLFSQVPRVLKTVWRRGLIDGSAANGDASSFLDYIDQFEQALLAKSAWLLALVSAFGSLFATYPFRYFMAAGEFPFNFGGMMIYYFGGQAAIIAPILGFIVGLLAWRVGTIAVFISRLGERFPLRVQVNHPDQAGGLKPIGDLAFNIAIIILIPSIFLAIWAFITTFFPDQDLALYTTLWGGLFRQLLVLLGVLSLFAFFQPLYRIHLRMEAHAQRVRAELDSLSQKIELLSQELRSQADEIDARQGEEQLKAIEFMKRVYAENSQLPTWPFHWRTLLQFIGAQAVPVLSLLGTSGPIIQIIQGLLSLAN